MLSEESWAESHRNTAVTGQCLHGGTSGGFRVLTATAAVSWLPSKIWNLDWDACVQLFCDSLCLPSVPSSFSYCSHSLLSWVLISIGFISQAFPWLSLSPWTFCSSLIYVIYVNPRSLNALKRLHVINASYKFT